MALLFAALFIGVPIIEIMVFIEAGDLIGLWPTIGVVIVTGIAGTFLLRHQGFSVLRRLQERSAAGEAPLREMFEGVCLLIAGAFLLTPGFVTDTIGFLLFLPPIRWAIARWVLMRFQGHIVSASSRSFSYSGGHTGGFGTGPRQGDDIIDGDFTTVSPDNTKPEQSDPPQDRLR